MKLSTIPWSYYRSSLDSLNPFSINGRVTKVVGLVIEGNGPGVSIGGVCRILPRGMDHFFRAEVVGFKENKVLLMPLGDLRGIEPGCEIQVEQESAMVGVGEAFLGRVVDPYGHPLDQKGPLYPETTYPLYADPINPLQRRRITQPLDVGIRAINGILTVGKGQRMGIFSGSGVGKSTLMGMMARYTGADVSVIGLIGERGREVREFIERDLGEEGLKRSAVVVATSDMPPLVRMRAAYMATVIAEYFRDQGRDVVLMMDSITRFAMAQREIGLSIGEPPTTRGYTPSVFALMPKLLERSGMNHTAGSITAFYTVLVEGDDFNEPISDAVRSILDGHIMLSRALAERGHYPAIDPLQSVSRVMSDVVDKAHRSFAQKAIEILATYRKAEDLINIGAYVSGSNPKIDYAIQMIDSINAYLKQPVEQGATLEESISTLQRILSEDA